MELRYRLFTLYCVVPLSLGYREYTDRIPNGDHVPHPCKENYIWHGLGHLNSLGGGALNVFGVDFKAENYSWTITLCNKDSDGDGKTNGQELGDPNCTWKEGTLPQRIRDITHPAICEPMENDTCLVQAVPNAPGITFSVQEEWLREACKSAEFQCDALNQTDDVRVMNLRMPPTPVPAQETTYMCIVVEFENLTGDFHMIATTPIINNSYVIHHMLLFGCEDDRPLSSPYECGMSTCSSNLIGGWGVGVTGQCFHLNAGVLLGENGYKRLMLQYHWNNPSEREDFVDSSGMALHYTPNLRQYNMAMLMVGQEYLQIPPFSKETITTFDCTPACTRGLMQGDIYVTTAANHMHYLGNKQVMELYRDNQFVTYIANDMIYNYDNPKLYFYDDPIVIKPGDMIRTTCHFSSQYKNKTTFWGEGTLDEMCYGFLEFYPAQNMSSPYCAGWRSLVYCDSETWKGCTNSDEGKFYTNFDQTQLYLDITSVCKPFGPCTEECKEAILQAKSREPCFNNEDTWRQLKWYTLSQNENGRNFLACLESCQLEIYQENKTDDITSTLKTTVKSTLKTVIVDDSGEGVKLQANPSTLLAAILFGILLSAHESFHFSF